jgi:hypothetical protein
LYYTRTSLTTNHLEPETRPPKAIASMPRSVCRPKENLVTLKKRVSTNVVVLESQSRTVREDFGMRKSVAAKGGKVISGPQILSHRLARRSRRSRETSRQAGVSHGERAAPIEPTRVGVWLHVLRFYAYRGQVGEESLTPFEFHRRKVSSRQDILGHPHEVCRKCVALGGNMGICCASRPHFVREPWLGPSSRRM